MDRTEIEAEIHRVLATETKAIPLSNRLFRPDGLFARLATTQEERRELTRTALFQEAQRRLSELQRSEMQTFRRAGSQVGDQLSDGVLSYRSEELPAGRP